MSNSNVEIKNLTKGKLINLPFVGLKKEILGDKYELSITFATPSVMRRANRIYRKQDRPTNVLSFSLTKNSGELLLCPGVIKNEPAKFGLSLRELFIYLTIHGFLHLNGYTHGSRMDKAEQKFFKIFRYK